MRGARARANERSAARARAHACRPHASSPVHTPVAEVAPAVEAGDGERAGRRLRLYCALYCALHRSCACGGSRLLGRFVFFWANHRRRAADISDMIGLWIDVSEKAAASAAKKGGHH